ncbi:MAG: hypothetical protein AAFQ80_22420 [Cyanobacteria bacterium J06621_8]
MKQKNQRLLNLEVPRQVLELLMGLVLGLVLLQGQMFLQGQGLELMQMLVLSMLLGVLLGLLLPLGLLQGQVLLMLLGLVLGLVQGQVLGLLVGLLQGQLLGQMLRELLRESLNRERQSSKIFPKSKTRLSRWIHIFLSDEEKAAVLIDYRRVWYGNKHPNKWTRFKVGLKTLHYLFFEVWFKERLDEIKSFRVGIPRR